MFSKDSFFKVLKYRMYVEEEIISIITAFISEVENLGTLIKGEVLVCTKVKCEVSSLYHLDR